MRISVVIPAFNAASRLSRAIRSAEDAAEVIIVDDGSTDATAEIAESFEGAKVIRQKNSGVSAARNRGVEAATGDYLCFLDDDDSLDSLSILSGEEVPHEAPDMIILRSFIGEKERYPWKGIFDENTPYSPSDLLSRGYLRGSACGVLFRREFLVENGIRFAEGVRLGEDTVFFAEALSRAGSVMFRDLPLYFITPREGSASRKPSETDIPCYADAIEAAIGRLPASPLRNLTVFKLIIVLTSRAAALRLGPGKTEEAARLRSGALPIKLDGISTERAKIRLLNFSYPLFYHLIALRDQLRGKPTDGKGVSENM